MRILLVCFLLLCFTLSFGQESFLGLQFGGVVGRTKLGNFKEFAKIYNKDYKGLLSKDMGNLTFSSGYEIVLDYSIYNEGEIGLMMQIGNENKFGRTSATFNDPALGKRIYQARFSSNTFFFGINFSEDQLALYFGPYLGTTHTFLSAFKKYENGELSYGGESGSNTVYSTRGFSFGLKFGGELFVHENMCLYASVLLGATLDLTSDLPMNLPSQLFPLIFINHHTTLQVGTKIGIVW